MTKFQPGDRVVFNANLDKSPDPENATIIGRIVRYANPGETYSGKSLRPDLCAFVCWQDDPECVTPVMDDWLEPAP